MLSYEDKLKLKEKFKNVNEHILIYIFNLLKSDNVELTQNDDGILFSDDKISDELLLEIYNYVFEIKTDP